ncbi:MAG: recombinase family protein [Anaerolineae bacterium]|nr:recombinase family protein [Anaerolineae bacterium]
MSERHDYEGAGYIRRSVIRKGREHETISPELQERGIRDKGAEIAATGIRMFRDLGGHRSGRTTKNRPDWVRLKAYLKSSESKFLIIYVLDRAARSVGEIAELIEICKQYGKRLITCYDGIDTNRSGFTADSIAEINMRATFAQYWSDKTSDAMTSTAREFRTELKIPWGMWPFGYARTGKGRQARLVPNDAKIGNSPSPAETARTLLTWYASGLSYEAVAQILNDHQYRHVDRHKQPKRWTREGVRAVVGNVLFYAGHIITHRWKAKEARIELEGEGTYLERYARHMKAEVSPAINPLITEELASSVIERRFKNQMAGRKSLAYTFLLTPIAYFGAQRLRGDSRAFGFFYCTRRAGVWIDAEKADADLIEHLGGIAFPPELRAAIRACVAERVGSARQQAAREEIAELDKRMQSLVDLLLDGQIQRTHYNERYTELDRALKSARAELTKEGDVERIMSTLSDLGSAIMLMTPENRKRAIHKLFERVEFDEKGEITRISLREWARQAFGELAFACRSITDAARSEHYANHAPGEQSAQIRRTDGLAWLLEHVA